MNQPTTAHEDVQRMPYAVFMGDFNVGKSFLINALLRQHILPVSREESHALPTFLTRAANADANFQALKLTESTASPLSHTEFLHTRLEENNDEHYHALMASVPETPFHRLICVDTAGTSSAGLCPEQLDTLAQNEDVLFFVVTDIEYWSARHTMDFIAHHHHLFGNKMMVLANKADYLNGDEIRRICERAPKRMEAYGISPAPRFLPVSARLELSRNTSYDEYRHRMKSEVRWLCDAGFDALRVALYEFEARHLENIPGVPTDQLMTAPLVRALSEYEQEEEGAVS